jgi:hypothetical protein
MLAVFGRRLWYKAATELGAALCIRALGLLSVFLMMVGCGGPALDSLYVPMSDGTELAVDVWLPRETTSGDTVPAIMRLGRYWRDYQLPQILPAIVGKYPGSVAWLNAAGYAVVAVDVRGTGASFGEASVPFSPQEVGDFPQLVDWVVSQPWSNGRVGAVGVSYEGVTSDWLGALGHPAVKAVLPTYSYSDIYLDVSHPGGIFNERFIKAWSEVTARMDRNDITFLDIVAAADPRGWLAILGDLISAILLGVRPISGAANQLNDALSQHASNTNVFEAASEIEYRDDDFGGVTVDRISPLLGAGTTTRAAAIRRVVGWLDAGTTRGALRDFNTLNVAYHVVVIVPETHTGDYPADPYDFNAPVALRSSQVITDIWEAVPFLDTFLKPDGPPPGAHVVLYYTYVEQAWKQTTVWPPEGFERQRWYCTVGGRLSRAAPTDPTGEDSYAVNFDATTGTDSRWFSGLGGVPIRYTDRAEQDQLLLVYETPPLEQSYELTGHPIISLQVKSTHADGAFYVYLEDVESDDRVVYLTEGELRAVHRAVSTESPPAVVFGPYHTFRRADAQPLMVGEVTELSFDLLPISTIIRAGHRLRVALAGHDADNFTRYPTDGTPVLTLERNASLASWIDLPLKARPDLDE